MTWSNTLCLARGGCETLISIKTVLIVEGWGLNIPVPFPEGITLDILAQEFWVPGCSLRADAPQYQGKDQFQQILKADESICVLWALRATQEI